MGNSMWEAVANQPYQGHDHFWQRAMSRRQFLGTSAGAAAAMATSPLWYPVLADASGRDPVPIPGGFAPNYHAFLGPGVDPSTIFNYKGTTGVAAVRGTGTGWNTETGQSTALLFDSDNRFMRGEYIGMDGREHEGTFGFVWLDIYKDQVDPLDPKTHQLHDISPGIAPSGLFWTVRIPDHWVSVESDDLGEGARYRIDKLKLLDYGTLANSLPEIAPAGTQFSPPSRATASFEMRWMGNTGPADATDSGPNQFTMKGIMTHATMGWSCSVPGKHFKFQSAAASTSHETFAALVNERNGSFFTGGEDQTGQNG